MNSPMPVPRRAAWVHRALAAGVLALAASAYLFVALPLLIYDGNRAEFDATWPALLQPFALVGATVVVASAVLAALLPEHWFRRMMVLAAALCVLAWVQGTLLVWHYGPLDGGNIDWSQARWRGWIDATLWIGALLVVDAKREQLARVLPRLAIVACLMQCVLAGWQLSRHAQLDGPAPAPASTTQLARFSSRGNVLHILADGMQTGVVKDLLDEDGGKLSRQLDGFVLFEDNLGAFPYTHMSVPAMLGGRVYDNARRQDDFLAEALGRDSIFGAARAAGFDVQAGIPGGGIREVYRHATDARIVELPGFVPSSSWRGARQESLELADLSLFRIVPHFAKRYAYNDQAWLFQALFGSTAAPGRAYLADHAFLRQFAATARRDAGRPAYTYLHLMLSHRPIVMNRDCSYAGRILPTDREHVRDQTRCALRSVVALLARMRALGVYDNTTVVVAGDHGAFVPPRTLPAGGAQARQALALGLSPAMVGQARPVLLVKRPRAHGPLRRSEAPTSSVDIPATIADAAGFPLRRAGVSAFRLDPQAPRRRQFNVYAYGQGEWTAPYLAPIQQYEVEGRTNDIASWSKGALLAAPPGQR